MAFGLTAFGFNRKTTEELLAELETSELALISSALDVSAETPIGQLNGIFAAKLGELWELAEEVFGAFDPDAAGDQALDAIAALTGTFRALATKGTVTLTVGLDATTTLSAGAIAQVTGDPTNRWVTLVDVTSVGAGDFSVAAEAEIAGNVPASTGTIEVIVTPSAGWNTVTNALAATAGTDIDTDAELRARREDELTLAGSATANAIRADLRVTGVTSVVVFFNNTLVTDVDGVPGKAVEALVEGGADQDIADALFDTIAVGIEPFGSVTNTVIDSNGNSQTVDFSRPTLIVVVTEIDIVTGVGFPVGGDALVATAIADFENALAVGKDVNRFEVAAAALTITGVINVTDVRLAESPGGPISFDLVLTSREKATAIIANITVSSTPGTP